MSLRRWPDEKERKVGPQYAELGAWERYHRRGFLKLKVCVARSCARRGAGTRRERRGSVRTGTARLLLSGLEEAPFWRVSQGSLPSRPAARVWREGRDRRLASAFLAPADAREQHVTQWWAPRACHTQITCMSRDGATRTGRSPGPGSTPTGCIKRRSPSRILVAAVHAPASQTLHLIMAISTPEPSHPFTNEAVAQW